MLLWFVLSLPCVHAIPKFAKPPADFTKATEKIVLTSEQPHRTGDDLCSHHYGGWWAPYQLRRDRARLSEQKDALIRADFTRYPDPQETSWAKVWDVPVESFDGERFKPSVQPGFRQDKWGCFTACQDIRTTVEWMLTAHFENKVEQRARAIFAFLCMDDEMAVEYQEMTRREETLDEEAVIEMFKARPEWKYIAKLNKLEMYGDRGPMLTKCKCVRAPENERLLAAEHFKKPYKRSHPEYKTEYDRKGRRAKFPAWDGGTLPVSRKPWKSRPLDLSGLSVEHEREENTISCYDFDITSDPIDTEVTHTTTLFQSALLSDFDAWLDHGAGSSSIASPR